MGIFASVKAYATLGVIALILILGGLWRHSVAKGKATAAQLVAVQKDLATATATIKELRGTIDGQNTAIDQWKAAGQVQADKATAATANASAIRSAYEVKVQAALSRPAPADPAKDVDWLAGEVAAAVAGGQK